MDRGFLDFDQAEPSGQGRQSTGAGSKIRQMPGLTLQLHPVELRRHVSQRPADSVFRSIVSENIEDALQPCRIEPCHDRALQNGDG